MSLLWSTCDSLYGPSLKVLSTLSFKDMSCKWATDHPALDTFARILVQKTALGHREMSPPGGEGKHAIAYYIRFGFPPHSIPTHWLYRQNQGLGDHVMRLRDREQTHWCSCCLLSYGNEALCSWCLLPASMASWQANLCVCKPFTVLIYSTDTAWNTTNWRIDFYLVQIRIIIFWESLFLTFGVEVWLKW
jgi:hypothetical protein